MTTENPAPIRSKSASASKDKTNVAPMDKLVLPPQGKLTPALQKHLLKLLVALDKLLSEHHIEYFLAFGSALGAVRHNGFIPWDDDVDIFIRPSEYLKLKQLFAEEKTGNLAFHSYDTVKRYPLDIPKIVDKTTMIRELGFINTNYCGGVWIDVYILADAPKTWLGYKLFMWRRDFHIRVIRANFSRWEVEKHKLSDYILRRCFDAKHSQAKIERLYTKSIPGHTQIINTGCISHKLARYDNSVFASAIQHPFEGYQIPIMVGYDEYLRQDFGDYMQLPPVEQRVTHHKFKLVRLRACHHRRRKTKRN